MVCTDRVKTALALPSDILQSYKKGSGSRTFSNEMRSLASTDGS